MKKIVAVALLCFFAIAMAVSQDVDSQAEKRDPASVLKDFTRSTKMQGVNISFVLLNDKTIDLIFSGESRNSIKARASQATGFYVLAVPERDMMISNKFVVEQNGQAHECSSINIENFAGGNVARGQRIKGILQLSVKLDLTRPFVIKNAQNKLEFKLSDSALRE
ncbi:MAG: hypothetical protein H6Q04_3396 [Acidobacteria bacterium]|jgi:hypothetical protein|nr:hypothetical protein [Acidobacteriota bacterium]